jgi:hypothetical protein
LHNVVGETTLRHQLVSLHENQNLVLLQQVINFFFEFWRHGFCVSYVADNQGLIVNSQQANS